MIIPSCTTCRCSNESYKEATDNCGDCLEDSEEGKELPRYIRSLAWAKEEGDV